MGDQIKKRGTHQYGVESLKNVLKKIIHSTPHAESRISQAVVQEAWSKAVGDRIAKRCWAIKLLEDGKLLVGSDSNAWIHQLQFLEDKILKKINAVVPPPIKVQKLIFRLSMPESEEVIQK